MNNKEWLNSPYSQEECPYCGEEVDINFEREDDGYETTYWATCGRCHKIWGQAYHLVFDFNMEE